MDLGTAVAIFISLAIFLLTLFCLITKYFNYRLRKAMEDANQIYSMIDDMHCNSEEEVQGEYDAYLKKRDQGVANPPPTIQPEKYAIEMTEIKQPLNVPSDIYGMSLLRRRLNGEVVPLKQQSNRSTLEMKSFRPQKMTSHRSDRTVIEKDDFSNKGDNVTHYKIVNKLVAYTDEGVELLEVHVQSLNKPNDTGAILDKRTLRKSIITNFDDNFDDQLEILGFDKGQFSANKYETDYEIPDMKTGEWYSTKSLKTSNCKEQIDLAQFNRLKEEVLAKQSA